MNERMYYSHEAEQAAMRQRTMLAIFVLALGVGVGAALSMLFAPQSGDKTREALAGQAEQTLEGISKGVARLRREVEDRVGAR